MLSAFDANMKRNRYWQFFRWQWRLWLSFTMIRYAFRWMPNHPEKMKFAKIINEHYGEPFR